MNKIIINRGNTQINELELTHGDLTIGRNSENDLHLNDQHLSSHHAKFVTLLDITHVVDLDSTNGTFINGKKVKRHTLQNDDVVTLGEYTITFVSDIQDQPASEHQETMQLDQDQLMKMIDNSTENAPSRSSPHVDIALDISNTGNTVQSKAPRSAPSLADLEAQRDETLEANQLKKHAQPAHSNSQNTTPTHITPKANNGPNKTRENVVSVAPAGVSSKAKKPKLHDIQEKKYAHHFEKKEEKQALLSPVTVYILTVAVICIIALLLLPYIDT